MSDSPLPDHLRDSDTAWLLAAGVVGLLAAAATRKGGRRGYRALTGHPPPGSPQRPRASIGEALLWAAVSGAVVNLGRMLARRGLAQAWGRDVT